jgi:hypothetical protein
MTTPWRFWGLMCEPCKQAVTVPITPEEGEFLDRNPGRFVTVLARKPRRCLEELHNFLEAHASDEHDVAPTLIRDLDPSELDS